MQRRDFLRHTGYLFALAVGAEAPAFAAPKFQRNPFTLGIASGDPLPDGVVLWTRLAPEPLAGGGMIMLPSADRADRRYVACSARL